MTRNDKGAINVHLLSTSGVVTWGLNRGHAYPQSVGRPSLSVGTAGRVRTYRTGTGWRARTLYRDYDGITRDLERAGKTRGAAERALAEALRDRVRISGTDVIGGEYPSRRPIQDVVFPARRSLADHDRGVRVHRQPSHNPRSREPSRSRAQCRDNPSVPPICR